MHVLMFNLRMDLGDPVLAFASGWVEAIAERVERVTVVTMASGRIDPPNNVEVRSVGKERGWSEPRRAAAFYQHCLHAISTGRPDVCFSHMIPVFSVLFSPLARLYRIPTLLWYAHGAVPAELRLAERLVDRCVTSTREGFRMESTKLFVLQQGIDVSRLQPPRATAPEWDHTVVSLGRIGPVKRLIETVEAIAVLRRDDIAVKLEIFGAPATPHDEDYERRVRAHVQALGMEHAVNWQGRVGFEGVGDAYRRGGTFLNLSRSGSLDKAILEAMACGCIPVSNNDAFAALARQRGWDDLVPADSVDNVADVLRTAILMPSERQAELRAQMRRYVASEHRLDQLADRIVAHLRDLANRRRSAGAAA